MVETMKKSTSGSCLNVREVVVVANTLPSPPNITGLHQSPLEFTGLHQTPSEFTGVHDGVWWSLVNSSELQQSPVNSGGQYTSIYPTYVF